jgi:hypothetical protein
MYYITKSDYNALHNDYKGVWDSDHLSNTKYNGKKTWMRFVEGKGTCLLIEGEHFEFVEVDEDGTFITDCECCSGNGYVEEMDCHVGSASICCGGCYKNVECEECNGTGEQENDYEGI